MKIELAARAIQEAVRCARWWRDHRPAAAGLFDGELRIALDQIRAAPRLGCTYLVAEGHEHRRLLMPRTRHHVYYRVVEPDRVLVVSVWSAVRGRGPRL